MPDIGHKKKRPILAAHLSPLQAFLPVAMYPADSYVSTAQTVDQHPAAASSPWPILVGLPAQYHVSVCFVLLLASTVILNPISLASYPDIASRTSHIILKYGKTVSTFSPCYREMNQ